MSQISNTVCIIGIISDNIEKYPHTHPEVECYNYWIIFKYFITFFCSYIKE